MPVPGVSCAGAAACGANRLCAKAPAGAQTTATKTTAAINAATAQRRKDVPKPHLPMALFLETNRGNFKPTLRPAAHLSPSRRAESAAGKILFAPNHGAISEFCCFRRLFDLGRFHHIQPRGLLSPPAWPIMRTAQARQAELLSCWMRYSGVRRMILK